MSGQRASLPGDEIATETCELAMRIRTMLRNEMDAQGITGIELARRLDVSPSVVSRVLSSTGDMRISTAILFGLAMGLKLVPVLHRMLTVNIVAVQAFVS